MLDCKDAREFLPLYAGGELDENERIAVEAHLGQCPVCATESSAYREQRILLGSLPEAVPPGGDYSFLWNGLRRELFPRKGMVSFRWDWAYAAVLLLGLSVGYLVIPRSGPAVAGPDSMAELVQSSPVSAAGTAAGGGPVERTSPSPALRPVPRPTRHVFLPRATVVPGRGSEVRF